MSTHNKLRLPYFVKLLSLILIVTGIIPWDSFFYLDIRSEIIITLNSGGLFFAGIILLQLVYLINFLIHECTGRVARIILLILGILLSSYCAYINTFFQPNVWQDKGIYQNTDDYIILQFNDFGILGEHTEWRLIKTTHPDLPIRNMTIIKSGDSLSRQLALTETGDYAKPIPVLIWKKKTWRLISFY